MVVLSSVGGVGSIVFVLVVSVVLGSTFFHRASRLRFRDCSGSVKLFDLPNVFEKASVVHRLSMCIFCKKSKIFAQLTEVVRD
jgi:hypothetical protein